MKLQLNNTEILTAINQYVTTLGIDLTNKSISIEFVQGRKNGISADISIDETTDKTEVTATNLEVLPVAPDAPINDLPDEAPESIDGSQSIFK